MAEIDTLNSLMSISRKLIPVSIVLVTIALHGCGKTLDNAKIETQIKEGITKEGGNSLKSVICPADVKPEAGRVFECVGVLDSKAGFAIPVKQVDDKGAIVWDVATVKGLLNMAKLQDEFAQGIKKEVGPAKVDCASSTYRAAKPGETFECKLIRQDDKTPIKVVGSAADAKPTKSNPKPAQDKTKLKEDDVIQVTIQPSGDINWQRIIKVPGSAIAALPGKDGKPEPAPKDGAKDAKDSASKDAKDSTAKDSAAKADPEPPSAAAPAAKSATDFLNQPGAADDFN